MKFSDIKIGHIGANDSGGVYLRVESGGVGINDRAYNIQLLPLTYFHDEYEDMGKLEVDFRVKKIYELDVKVNK